MRSPGFSLIKVNMSFETSDMNTIDAIESLLQRSGFEIVITKNEDVKNKFNDNSKKENHWMILLDTLPWREKQTRFTDISWSDNSENYRVDWAIVVVQRFLNTKNVSFTQNTGSYSSEELLSILKDSYPEEYTSVINSVKSMQFPFELIEEYTDLGCNNRIGLVSYNNIRAICKIFKLNKLNCLENEIEARKKINNSIPIPSIIKREANSILIEYIPDSKDITSLFNKYNLLKIRYAKKIFKDLKTIYCSGVSNLDFHTGNILVSKENKLFYYDFEYIHHHQFEYSLLDGPGLNEHNKLHYFSPLEHITYHSYWYPYIKLSKSTILNSPLALLSVIRSIQILFIELGYIKKKIMRRIRPASRFQVVR